jgi:hypothetical protein
MDHREKQFCGFGPAPLCCVHDQTGVSNPCGTCGGKMSGSQREIEHHRAGLWKAVYMSFKAIVQQHVAGLNPKSSMISSLFISA